MSNNQDRVREWINTTIAIIGLIVLIIGMWLGISELNEVNINLKEIKSEKVSTQKIELLSPNGSVTSCIQSDGSHSTWGPCE